MVHEQIVGLPELDAFAQKLIPLIMQARIVALIGPLGAGKTTLVRALARQMHIAGAIVSPTFTYMVTYQMPNGMLLHHFDLYRISSVQQFYEAGFNEYLNQPNSLVFIEWPEVIRDVLPDKTLTITFEYIDIQLDKRKITITTPIVTNQ
jgi:tRNA threonylcarbamoyladenosine biosynthesis protein TsaE